VIFVTVGTQGPFDRMLRPIDAWAARSHRDDVFAQIGRDAWQPTRVQWVESLDAPAFRSRIEQAEVVISHAGMGTILTALELGKPILVMPRRAALSEQRNDHQLATVKMLGQLGLVTVAADEHELAALLDDLGRLKAAARTRGQERERLIHALRDFLDGGSGA
jgi:exopolysaccharide biosynthesis glucuronosyltransferase PssE